MLPANQRLKRASLFTRAYSARKSVTTPLFTLYVLPHQEKAIKNNSLLKRVLPKIGFVVSKKISKSAYRRNTMKRRVKEAYRQMCTGNEQNVSSFGRLQMVRNTLNRWFVAILVVKESVLNATWPDICRTMEDAFLEAARRYG